MHIHEQDFLIQQMKSRATFGSSIHVVFLNSICLEKILWSPFSSRLRLTYNQNKDINYFYIMKCITCIQNLRTCNFQHFQELVPFRSLQFLIISRWLRHENGANVSVCLHNVRSGTSNVILCFAPWTTGSKFGSSEFIGSLKGQSEMTLNGMLSDPNNVIVWI